MRRTSHGIVLFIATLGLSACSDEDTLETTPDAGPRDPTYDVSDGGDAGSRGDVSDASAMNDAALLSPEADAALDEEMEPAKGLWREPNTSGVCEGDFSITSDFLPGVIRATLAQLATCVSITGDLDIDPELGSPQEVTFPVLKSVGGQLSMSAGLGISAIDFPALIRIGASLRILEIPHVTKITLPVLESIRGTLQITDTARLTQISMPVLRTTGGLSFSRNAGLTTLALPMLTSTTTAFIADNPVLSVLLLPKLEIAKYSFYIQGNPALTTLGLSALRTFQGYPDSLAFAIRNNTQLPQCHAEALRDQLTTLVGMSEVTGNGPGTCP